MYVAMLSVVWWTCALTALAAGHVYERCELARALSEQGIGRDHLSTWVCIAYHESRFDTAAQNYGSGDHGLLQISQLYWCGPGKACGVSCASLRDEDISNDVKCALQIYEEHTRIQGDGFMAWVVYPLYCKQNTKKYLEGCEEFLKNTTAKVTEKSRHRTIATPTSTPSFLSISSILRGQYDNEVNSVTDKTNWFEYRFDNVDDLTLPKFDESSRVSESETFSKSLTNAVATDKFQTDKVHKLPAYLAISSILQEYFEDVQQNNEGEKEYPDWVDVKFDNIDELKLPVLGAKKNTVVTLPPTKSKTRIKIEDTNNVESKISQNFPDYIKIGSIVGQYYGNKVKSNRPKNNHQNGWLDFAIEDIDKLVVPNKSTNGEAPFDNRKSSFETMKTIRIDNKSKLPPNLPAFFTVAPIIQNQQEHIKTQIRGDSRSSIKSVNIFPSLSTSTRIQNVDINKVSQNLPIYLNIIRQVYGNDFSQDNLLKTSTTNLKSQTKNVEVESIQPHQIIDHKYRQRSRIISHTSTTPESLTTERPPPPVKPSRIIESNQFRHRTSTIKPSPESQFETNLLKTTAIISTFTTAPDKPEINVVTSSHNIDEYSLTASNDFLPLLVKNISEVKLYTPTTWRKAYSEVSETKTTEKSVNSVLSPWNLSTLVPIIQSTTTHAPSTKITQSIYDFYLRNQRVSSTSTPKSWLDLKSTLQQTKLNSTSYPRFVWQQSTTLKPWLTSKLVTQEEESLSKSSKTTSKPWYPYTSSASKSIFTSKSRQDLDVTSVPADLTSSTSDTQLMSHESTTLSPWSASRFVTQGEKSFLKTSTTTSKPWNLISYSSSAISTSIPQSRLDLGVTSDRTDITSTTPNSQRISQVSTTISPWFGSRLITQGEDSFYKSSTTTSQPWYSHISSATSSTSTPKSASGLVTAPEESVFQSSTITSKPWNPYTASTSWSWINSNKKEATTQKPNTTYDTWNSGSQSTRSWRDGSWSISSASLTTPKTRTRYDPWTARYFSTSRAWSLSSQSSQQSETTTEKTTSGHWSWSKTSSSTQKNENKPIALNRSTTESWSWSKTPFTAQKPESTTPTSSTFKSRFTWDPLNPWSWSWVTEPSILPDNNSTTQSVTKSWDPRSFSTHRPWSWVTTTTTPSTFKTSKSFIQTSTSTSKTATNPRKSNDSYLTTPTVTKTRKPSTPSYSTTQSLFDLYLSNFGRTPLRRKHDQQSSDVSNNSSSEVSQATVRDTDSGYRWRTS